MFWIESRTRGRRRNQKFRMWWCDSRWIVLICRRVTVTNKGSIFFFISETRHESQSNFGAKATHSGLVDAPKPSERQQGSNFQRRRHELKQRSDYQCTRWKREICAIQERYPTKDRAWTSYDASCDSGETVNRGAQVYKYDENGGCWMMASFWFSGGKLSDVLNFRMRQYITRSITHNKFILQQKRPTTTHGSRPSTNQSNREDESWTNDDAMECVKKKSYIKKRYWRAVQGLSKYSPLKIKTILCYLCYTKSLNRNGIINQTASGASAFRFRRGAKSGNGSEGEEATSQAVVSGLDQSSGWGRCKRCSFPDVEKRKSPFQVCLLTYWLGLHIDYKLITYWFPKKRHRCNSVSSWLNQKWNGIWHQTIGKLL